MTTTTWELIHELLAADGGVPSTAADVTIDMAANNAVTMNSNQGLPPLTKCNAWGR